MRGSEGGSHAAGFARTSSAKQEGWTLSTRPGWKKLGLPVLVALTVYFLITPPVTSQSPSAVRSQIGQAYAAVLSAEQNGGNVTSLVVKLNTAVLMVHEADLLNATSPLRAQSLYSQASTLALQVTQAAPAAASAGRGAVFNSERDLGIGTAVLGVLAVLAYLYTPRLFWRLWLRAHNDWRVKKT